MNYKEEDVRRIGEAVINAINKYTEKTKLGEFVGKNLEIPIRCAQYLKSNEPDWMSSVIISMPNFVEVSYKNGKAHHQTVTLFEWYKLRNEKGES